MCEYLTLNELTKYMMDPPLDLTMPSDLSMPSFEADERFRPPKPINGISFPDRVPENSDLWSSNGERLTAFACALGPAGCRLGPGPTAGVWRGTMAGDSTKDIAVGISPILAGGIVSLHTCGTVASTGLAAGALRWLKLSGVDAGKTAEDEAEAAKVILGGSCDVFRLAGRQGQVLTHTGDLWAWKDAGRVHVLLRLKPLSLDLEAGRSVKISRSGPMGCIEETWTEVPLINLPHVLRATMVGTSDVEGSGLVVQCWCREEGATSSPGSSSALELDQLLWCNSLRGLADTPQCQLEAAPANRIRLCNEGSISQDQLVTAFPEVESDDKDAESRAACLACLRKYIPLEGLREDVVPRLFTEGMGQARLVSAKFAEAEATQPQLSKRTSKKIKSVDDLFGADGDFLGPAASFDSAPKDDPFKMTEFTSVHLVNEKIGFLLSLTCLQGYT